MHNQAATNHFGDQVDDPQATMPDPNQRDPRLVLLTEGVVRSALIGRTGKISAELSLDSYAIIWRKYPSSQPALLAPATDEPTSDHESSKSSSQPEQPQESERRARAFQVSEYWEVVLRVNESLLHLLAMESPTLSQEEAWVLLEYWWLTPSASDNPNSRPLDLLQDKDAFMEVYSGALMYTAARTLRSIEALFSNVVRADRKSE